jgi:hypothetical protein
MSDRHQVEGLRDLLRILWRSVQAHYLQAAYLAQDHGAPHLDYRTAMGFDGPTARSGEDAWQILCEHCFVGTDSSLELDLSRDIVLPAPWRPWSITRMPGSLGPDRPLGPFKQSLNHVVAWWRPLQVGWVLGGNHSIAAAIVSGSGRIRPEEVFDVEPLLDRIAYRGQQWTSLDTESTIGRPQHPEFGWAWEVARVLVATQRRIAAGEKPLPE